MKIRHPLVDMACKEYFHKSHIEERLNTGKASTLEEKGFKEEADKFVRDLEQHPHAFVLACLMDTGVEADVAWTIPYRAYRELGTFEIRDLYKIKEQDFINMFGGEKKWHRYPSKKAKFFYEYSRRKSAYFGPFF